MGTVVHFGLAVCASVTRRTLTSERTLARISALGTVLAGLVIGAVVQVCPNKGLLIKNQNLKQSLRVLTKVAQKSTPAFFADALVSLVAVSFLATDVLLARVAIVASPARSTFAIVRTLTISVECVASIAYG